MKGVDKRLLSIILFTVFFGLTKGKALEKKEYGKN